VFYCLDSGGEPVLTDLFRNALARLEPAERTVPDRAKAAHLLPNRPDGDVRRACSPARSRRDAHLVSGETTPRTELTETLEPEPGLSPTNAHERLDEVLSAICAPVAEEGTLMLSGGVDSTVLDPYLANPTESVTGSFDTPELEREREYADRANALVETDREVVEMRESSYLERLEAAVDALGMPPHQLQTPTFDGIFREYDGSDTLVSGQVADGVFGLGGPLEMGRKVWRTRHLRYVRPVGREVTATSGGPRAPPASAVGSGRAGASVRDRDGHSVGRRCDGTAGVRPATAGPLRVRDSSCPGRDRGQLRPPYARRPVGRLLLRGYGHYLATGRVRPRPRDVHAVAGKAVAELALGLPSPERYVHDGEPKYVPKNLLGEWYPEYDRSKPKGNGNFPADRFLSSGPSSRSSTATTFPSSRRISEARSSTTPRPRVEPGWLRRLA